VTRKKPTAPPFELPPAPAGLTVATVGPWEEPVDADNEAGWLHGWVVAVVMGTFYNIGRNDDEAKRHLAARHWLAAVPGWGLATWAQSYVTGHTELIVATLAYGATSVDPDPF
jgi:hypothetical protein